MNFFKFLFVNPFNKHISSGHIRSVTAKKNILADFFIKGGSVAISLLLVPLTINYVNPSRYGIWLTISSIVAWFSFFDIGLTQGLRNKFAEAKAKGDYNTAQIYVSTTYALLSLIFITIWIFFLFFYQSINWSKILKISESMQTEVATLAIIVVTYFCFSLIFKIITTILIADQQPAKSSLVDLFGQIVSLIFVFILIKTTKGSLINLGIALCASPLIVLTTCSLLLFKSKYKPFRPSLSKVKFSFSRSLLNLGFAFFIIQIANVLQFETANIIIARNFTTTAVTSYNIVYKYFGVLNMIFIIFLNPFWSASTEAYLNNDINWIKNWIKKYNQLNIILLAIGVLMLSFSQLIYRLWLGEGTVHIEFSLSLCGFLFFGTSVFGGKYVSFLNGISALRIQFISCIISPFLFIGIAFLLIKYYQMGVYSLFIASIIANFNTFIIAPLQYNLIINKGKKGIWIK